MLHCETLKCVAYPDVAEDEMLRYTEPCNTKICYTFGFPFFSCFRLSENIDLKKRQMNVEEKLLSNVRIKEIIDGSEEANYVNDLLYDMWDKTRMLFVTPMSSESKKEAYKHIKAFLTERNFEMDINLLLEDFNYDTVDKIFFYQERTDKLTVWKIKN